MGSIGNTIHTHAHAQLAKADAQANANGSGKAGINAADVDVSSKENDNLYAGLTGGSGGSIGLAAGTGSHPSSSTSAAAPPIVVHLGTFVYPTLPFPYNPGLMATYPWAYLAAAAEAEAEAGAEVEGIDGHESEPQLQDTMSVDETVKDGVNGDADTNADAKVHEGEHDSTTVKAEEKPAGDDTNLPVPVSASTSVSVPTSTAASKETEEQTRRKAKGKRKASPPAMTRTRAQAHARARAREVHATILIPPGFLPSQGMERSGLSGDPVPSTGPVRIWGGGLIQTILDSHSGMLIGVRDESVMYPTPAPGPGSGEGKDGARRVYTDDSDVLLAAVHAGRVGWTQVRAAKARGEAVRVHVAVVGAPGQGSRSRRSRRGGGSGSGNGDTGGEMSDGGEEEMSIPTRMESEGGGGPVRKYIGGWGERLIGSERDDMEDDGRCVLSAGWGNGHDGAGIEILGVEFVKVGIQRFESCSVYSVLRLTMCFALRSMVSGISASGAATRGFWSMRRGERRS
jgi:hypothetical protein